MQQFLPCTRCDRWTMIDLGLPVDLCDRCLRALGFGLELDEDDLTVLANAPVHVDDGAEWSKAVEIERDRLEE